jgi:NAD(P)H-flavin reductase
MFEVLSNDILAPSVYRLVVRAPRIAAARQPGQFVIVRHCDLDERIPLTIADADAQAGTITLIVQAIGPSTTEIVSTPPGGLLRDVAGPLGRATEIRKWGKVVCVGGGVGTAVLFPLAKALAEAGNEVTAVLGARSQTLVILRQELAAFCREVLVTTEDGSLGTKGFVTVVLDGLLADQARRPDAVFAVGPVAMMAAIAGLTRSYGVKTIVSLNPIMVDGTGMCGGCRVTVGGQIKFACVDGPEFDAHQVDFKELASRQATYNGDHCRLLKQAAKSRTETAK